MKGGGIIKSDQYEFQGEEARYWASWAHPELVSSVKDQLAAFCQRVKTRAARTDVEQLFDDCLPSGCVPLYQLVKEYDLGRYFVQKAATDLVTAFQVKYREAGWVRPRWVWVANEEEAREFLFKRRARRDRLLSSDADVELHIGS